MARQVDQLLADLRRREHEPAGRAELQRIESYFTAERIRKVAGQFKKNTAIGVDQVAFVDVADAPDQALAELAEIFREAARTMSLPTYSLISAMTTLGKKAGGSRCIAVASSFYRLFMAVIRPIVKD